MKKSRRYIIESSAYWRKFRQGVRKSRRGSTGKYSRRKRNNDWRFGARMNFRSSMPKDLQRGCNSKFRRRFKGAIRKQREACEQFDAQQAQLRKEVGL